MLLHGPGRSRDSGVAVEIALEVDRTLVEEGALDLVGLAQADDRSCPAPLDAVLLEHRDVADPNTTSAQPPLNSSSVAAS